MSEHMEPHEKVAWAKARLQQPLRENVKSDAEHKIAWEEYWAQEDAILHEFEEELEYQYGTASPEVNAQMFTLATEFGDGKGTRGVQEAYKRLSKFAETVSTTAQ